MSKHIAIVSVKETYDYNDDYSKSSLVAQSITSWDEVSDEDYDVLIKAERQTTSWRVLCREDYPFISSTIAEYKQKAKKLLEEQEARKKRLAAKKRQSMLKRLAIQKADKLKQYEELKKELEMQ